MGWSRQERIELHDKLVVLLDDVRKELMRRFPEVVSVDLGLKKSNGRILEQFAWRVFVREKKAERDLKPEEMIPREILGVPTDVLQYLEPELEVDDEAAYRPLWGGIQIQGVPAGAGTLGCFVVPVGDTKVHILSNHHVLQDTYVTYGHLVGQPLLDQENRSACCLCCNAAGIAKVVNAADTALVDAAIAVLLGYNVMDLKTVHYSNNILEIGPVFGSGVAAVGDIVRKRGRTTRLTQGIVTSLTAVVSGKTNQIAVDPVAPCLDWSAPGDSGSAVVNNLNQVVGLHFAGTRGGPDGWANIISNVMAALNINILSSATIGTGIPLSGIAEMEIPAMTAKPTNFLENIEQRLRQSAGGQQFLQIIHENRGEVMDLINDNREVKVAWNRFQGPAYVGHLLKNALEPDHLIPDIVNGYSMQNLLIKMSDVLERHGSRKLAQAVEDYAGHAFQFAHHYTGLDSLAEIFQGSSFCPNCGQPQNTSSNG